MSEPQVIGERYTLLRHLGAGAMGTVWLARDETLHREVAVKQVSIPGVVARQRAMREGRLIARLSHPNAVSIFDIVLQNDSPWLVMEYVPSQTLAEVVQADGPIPPARAALLGRQVAAALAEAHRVGIVHRDVKPSNVLLTETGSAKITDFGIARGGEDTLTETGLLAGTPAYFSPELARGESPTPAGDVWALGATLYYAVEGDPPFGTDSNPLVLLGRVAYQPVPTPRRAGALRPILLELLAREPADRPTMAEARAMLSAAEDGTTVSLAIARHDGFDETSYTREFDEYAEPHEDLSSQDDQADEEHEESFLPYEKTSLTGPESPGDNGDETPAESQTRTFVALDPRLRAAAKRRNRRAAVIAACVVVLGLGSLGSYLLLGQRTTSAGNQPKAAISGNKPSGTAPSTSRITQTPKPKPSTPKPSKQASTKPPTKTPEKRVQMRKGPMEQAVRDYYALLPNNPGAAWKHLGPSLRTFGLEKYKRYWSSVDSVQVLSVTAKPATRRVTIRLRTDPRSRGPVTETKTLSLVISKDGKHLLINTDSATG